MEISIELETDQVIFVGSPESGTMKIELRDDETAVIEGDRPHHPYFDEAEVEWPERFSWAVEVTQGEIKHFLQEIEITQISKYKH